MKALVKLARRAVRLAFNHLPMNWRAQPPNLHLDTYEMQVRLGTTMHTTPQPPGEWDHEYVTYRLKFLAEELSETIEAYADLNEDEFVDGLIDLVYVAVGTLVALGYDFNAHWRAVHTANMRKVPGVVTKRGYTRDAVKPEGWTPPDHMSIINQQRNNSL